MSTNTKLRFRALPIVVLVCTAMAATMIATAGVAGAAAPLANLKITDENVTVKQKGASDFVAAKEGQALKQGDTIKTDANGRAEIDYTDGSLTRLAGSTVFTISKLTNERGGRQTQGTLSVGETWNRAAKVSETGSFEVKAGGTTAAVEGTAFVVSCVPKENGKQEVTCTVTAVVDDIKVSSDAWDVTSVTNAS
ncbi:MAG TPA: FecR family protein [Acidimicrobiia bacterium]|nr:FecR family protein [Acidimicrobiia bacterium]